VAVVPPLLGRVDSDSRVEVDRAGVDPERPRALLELPRVWQRHLRHADAPDGRIKVVETRAPDRSGHIDGDAVRGPALLDAEGVPGVAGAAGLPLSTVLSTMVRFWTHAASAATCVRCDPLCCPVNR
jgi:hypothetical protein